MRGLTQPTGVTVSGKKLKPAPVELIDFTPLGQFLGRRIDGVVGGKLFSEYAVELDYRRSRAVALAKGERDFTGLTAIPLSTQFGLCCLVQLRLSIGDEEMAGRFLIDTGAPGVGVALGPAFARAHHLLPAAGAAVTTLPALCAPTSLAHYDRLSDVRIGDIEVRDVEVTLSLDQGGAFVDGGFDGIVGGEFLRRFGEVVVDGPKGRLLIKIK